MIDWVRVADLRGEVGSDGFEEVVLLFMEETDAAVRSLSAAATSSALEETLHFLKGSALNLGFVTVSRLCQEGERLAADGQGANVDLDALAESYWRARADFLAGLGRLPPI